MGKGKRLRAGRKNKDGSATVPMSDGAAVALEEQRQAFVKKFGREPGPRDPVFFDPDLPASMGPVPLQPVHTDMLTDQMRVALVESGAPPDIIHAFDVTGRLLIDPGTYARVPQEWRDEWDAAIAEYHQQVGAES